VIVAAFPGQEGLCRWCEAVEGGAAPELFFIHTVTAFDLSILFRPTRFDVPQANPGFLYGEREGEGELGAVVDLDFANGERQGVSHRGQEVETGAVILARVEPQDTIARAVIDGGVLKTFLAGDLHFLDIDLHTVTGVFFTEKPRVA